jgi:hypothetical protein
MHISNTFRYESLSFQVLHLFIHSIYSICRCGNIVSCRMYRTVKGFPRDERWGWGKEWLPSPKGASTSGMERRQAGPTNRWFSWVTSFACAPSRWRGLTWPFATTLLQHTGYTLCSL